MSCGITGVGWGGGFQVGVPGGTLDTSADGEVGRRPWRPKVWKRCGESGTLLCCLLPLSFVLPYMKTDYPKDDGVSSVFGPKMYQ